MQEIENAALDIPDERDYQYEVLMWNTNFENIKIEFPKIEIFNQGLKAVTKMSCTRAGLGHIINAQRILNGESPIDIEGFWLRYLEINPGAEKEWATIQSALKQAKDEWLIENYFEVKNEDQMNDAFWKWFFIYSGSNNGDWAFVRDKKIYRVRPDWKILWHAFMFPSKEKILNSYGKDNWYAFFPKELYSTTYTKYAIVPKNGYNLDLIYKNIIMSKIKLESARKAMENWFWNWVDGEKPVTREEASAMIQRVYEKLSAVKKE